jgi:hypothetical protein
MAKRDDAGIAQEQEAIGEKEEGGDRQEPEGDLEPAHPSGSAQEAAGAILPIDDLRLGRAVGDLRPAHRAATRPNRPSGLRIRTTTIRL